MKAQVLFVQGGGKGTYADWDVKLVNSLKRGLGAGYEIRYPRMPKEADPSYAAWKAALEGQFTTLEDSAILVGHSLGATILVNVLAELGPKRKSGGIFLIAAPFVGEGGWPSEDIEGMKNLGARLSKTTAIFLYHGSEDDTAPFAHLHLYAKAIPQAVKRPLAGRDHQLNNDLSEVAADIRRLVG